jgi:hypothetical protein
MQNPRLTNTFAWRDRSPSHPNIPARPFRVSIRGRHSVVLAMVHIRAATVAGVHALSRNVGRIFRADVHWSVWRRQCSQAHGGAVGCPRIV